MQISISIGINNFSLGGKDFFLVTRVIALQFLTIELFSIDFRNLKLFSTIINISRRENARVCFRFSRQINVRRAYERVHKHNEINFRQAKLYSKINAHFEHGDLYHFYCVLI